MPGSRSRCRGIARSKPRSTYGSTRVRAERNIRLRRGPAFVRISLALIALCLPLPSLAVSSDDGAHLAYPREWWRFTSRVRTGDDHDFALVATFFRYAVGARGEEAIAATLAVSDLASGTHVVLQRSGRTSLGDARALTAALSITTGSWSVVDPEHTSRSADDVRISAGDGSVAVRLVIGAGAHRATSDLSDVFGDGDAGSRSHVRVRTRLPTSGTLLFEGHTYAINGTSWMDHAYGDAALSFALGSDVCEVGLSNGYDVIVIVRREPSGAQRSRTIVLSPSGATRLLPVETTTWRRGIGPYFWRSRVTGKLYPNIYHLVVPDAGIDVTISPTIPDQEIVANGQGITYWDGAVDVTNLASDPPVTGSGFAHLSGR